MSPISALATVALKPQMGTSSDGRVISPPSGVAKLAVLSSSIGWTPILTASYPATVRNTPAPKLNCSTYSLPCSGLTLTASKSAALQSRPIAVLVRSKIPPSVSVLGLVTSIATGSLIPIVQSSTKPAQKLTSSTSTRQPKNQTRQMPKSQSTW